MSEIIEPHVLKGFRDFLPSAEIERKLLIQKLETVFQNAGFVPIDTPVLEYADILLGKSGGETEKQTYRFIDHGGRDVAMRFDLTIPFARYMACHVQELYLPFKRYHINKVWRGEKNQRGRYREFMQCDFDFVGTDSAGSDFEILTVMHDSMKALGIDKFIIKFSHRGIFNRFLALIGALDQSVEVLRIVDKLAKIGKDEVLLQLTELVGNESAQKIVEYVNAKGSFDEVLNHLEKLSGGENDDTIRMRTIYSYLKQIGIESSVCLDPSITRGLDYYTGIVFETFLLEIPELGSVCSGGRYNDLASLFTKEKIPGVGASVGLDRLLAGLEELGTSKQIHSFSNVAIFCMDESLLGYYHTIARAFRVENIACEVFPDKKKLQQQFAVAEKKSIQFAIIIGTDEKQKNIIPIKDLNTRDTIEVTNIESAVLTIKGLLSKK